MMKYGMMHRVDAKESPPRWGRAFPAHFRALAVVAAVSALMLAGSGEIRAHGHGQGAILDDAVVLAQPAVFTLSRRDAENLPRAHSLKAFCPTPGDQGETSTCGAWSSAYHARTMLEAIVENRRGAAANDEEVFSPSFVYNQIRQSEGCEDGTMLPYALKLIREKGCLKASVLRYDCDFDDWERYEGLASPFVIKHFLSLHQPYGNNKVLPVKKALLEGQPVVIGMHLTKSFHATGSDGLYRPTAADRELDLQEIVEKRRFSGHAMTVVGYDDSKGRHGAVQIINSWGPRWAEGGFCWVEYEDFNRFVHHSFSMIGESPEPIQPIQPPKPVQPILPPRPVQPPPPPPPPQPVYRPLAGLFLLETERGVRMKGEFDGKRGVYRLAEKHPAGTRFRIYLKNERPVYLYAFGFDQTAQTFDVFPHQAGISPYIPYHKAHVPIPDDDHFIEIDAVPQRNDLCVIYSAKELPIAKLKERLRARGSRILDEAIPLRRAVVEELQVLGFPSVPEERTSFQPDDFSFSAKRDEEVCVPVVLEFGS